MTGRSWRHRTTSTPRTKTQKMDNENELVLTELKRVHLSEFNQTTWGFLRTQVLFNVLRWCDDNEVSVSIRLKSGCAAKMKFLWLKRSRICKNVQKKDRWTTKQPRFDWIKTRSFVSINFQILVLWSDNSIDPTELKKLVLIESKRVVWFATCVLSFVLKETQTRSFANGPNKLVLIESKRASWLALVVLVFTLKEKTIEFVCQNPCWD